VMCGKHTMVRLQISLQASKQQYQSSSRNAATMYHRLPNERVLGMIALHGVTRAPNACPHRAKKVTQATNRAPRLLCGTGTMGRDSWGPLVPIT
jgi:hypothetical protein